MSLLGSVSGWIAALKLGNRSAAQPLWQRYYRRLVALARKVLRGARPRFADEEDVVQNAFHSFFRGLGVGRFPRLEGRDGLWRLLVVITCNKALKQLKHDRRQKRGGDLPAKDASAVNPSKSNDELLLKMADTAPTPDFAAQVAEDCQRLLDLLGDDTLRQVAVWKMEGYGNREIADKLSCSRRTVARKMDAIRFLWADLASF